jgi:hypothetical protein
MDTGLLHRNADVVHDICAFVGVEDVAALSAVCTVRRLLRDAAAAFQATPRSALASLAHVGIVKSDEGAAAFVRAARGLDALTKTLYLTAWENSALVRCCCTHARVCMLASSTCARRAYSCLRSCVASISVGFPSSLRCAWRLRRCRHHGRRSADSLTSILSK